MPALAYASEALVEFLARHRERKMHASVGSPRSKLERELGGNAHDEERLAFALVGEPEHRRVEVDGLLRVIHGQDHVVELWP